MKSGFKKILPAFIVNMFSGMARSKYEKETQGSAMPPGRKRGKSKGGRKARGFLTGLPRRMAGGTPLGMAIFRYEDKLTGASLYGRPNEQGMRELMAKNWCRENKGVGG